MTNLKGPYSPNRALYSQTADLIVVPRIFKSRRLSTESCFNRRFHPVKNEFLLINYFLMRELLGS